MLASLVNVNDEASASRSHSSSTRRALTAHCSLNRQVATASRLAEPTDDRSGNVDHRPAADRTGHDVTNGSGALSVYITSSTSCEAAIAGQRQEWFGLEMGLPSGSTMLIATNFDTICGVTVSAFGQPSP